jgi:transcriptional regulator with XRE-family HTH domain
MEVIDNANLRETLAANLRRIRKQQDLTQEELARKVGISAVHLNRIEQGHSSPSAEVLFAIADTLGVKTDALRQLPVSRA